MIAFAMRWLTLFFISCLILGCKPSSNQGANAAAAKTAELKYVNIIVPLGDPAKLATLTTRDGAADRLVKICYHLHEAQSLGIKPQSILSASIGAWGWEQSPKGQRTATAILGALETLQNYGCFDQQDDRENMRRGNRPVIRRGFLAGEPIEMDHIVPVAVAPEWTNVIANLQPLPQSVNRSKSDTITPEVERHRLKLKAAGF